MLLANELSVHPNIYKCVFVRSQVKKKSQNSIKIFSKVIHLKYSYRIKQFPVQLANEQFCWVVHTK